MLLQNLPPRHVTEAAIAAAQLLPHDNAAAAQMLQRADAIPALVAAFLEEHAHADLDPVAGKLLPPLCAPAPAFYSTDVVCSVVLL